MVRLAFCLLALLAAGCGTRVPAASPRPHPYSLAQVRRSFAAHGLHPDVVFDFSRTTDAQIDRLARAWAGIAAMVPYQRAALHEFQAHGISLLTFRSGSSEAGDVAVAIAPDWHVAAGLALNERRSQVRGLAEMAKQAHISLKKMRADAASLQLPRNANVVAIFSGGIPRAVAAKVRAAVSAL